MIGERIRKLRLEKSISMTELAQKAGVAKSYLSALESGKQQNPSINFLDKVATVLGTTSQALLNEKSEQADIDALDEDWMKLAKEAADSGISKEQFRSFLEFTKWQQKKK